MRTKLNAGYASIEKSGKTHWDGILIVGPWNRAYGYNRITLTGYKTKKSLIKDIQKIRYALRLGCTDIIENQS